MNHSVRYGDDATPAPGLPLGVFSALASAGWRPGLRVRSPRSNPKQSEARLEFGPQNLGSSESIGGCIEWLRLRPCSRTVSALLFAFLFLPLAQAADFYVATNGSDMNSGTINQPFATLTKARDAARALGTNALRNIFVRGGHYYNVALVLQREPGADDSGLTIQGYPGETAVLYGGMLLTNWVSGSNGWYAAALPLFPTNVVSAASTLADWQVRMLLVDGVMAIRAEYPTNGGSLYYNNRVGSYVLGYTNGDLGSWLSVTNAEFQIDHSYTASTVGCAAINAASHEVTFLTQPQFKLPYAADVKTYRVFNIAQGMSKPGQFYYDRASRSVVYWPLAGQNPNAVECVVPTTTRVFFINGRQYSRPWGITFSDLTLAVSTAPLQAEGDDATAVTCGLIQTGYIDKLTLDGLLMGRTAAHAFYSRSASCTNEYIRNCVVAECGASGIQSGAIGAIISNNFVHSIGMMSPQAPGIWLASSSTVIRNDVFDCSMSAIEGNYVNNSYIMNNHASNCMQVLRDLGAIYTWTGTNNVIASNLLEHIGGYVQDGSSALDWFHFGIYCDNYTYGYLIYDNVTRDVPRPLMIHSCSNHIITNNFFVNTSDIIELCFRANPATNIIFQRNICYSTTNLYAGYYVSPGVNVDNWNAVVDWRSNIFYSVIGGAAGRDNSVGAETGVAGIPTNAVALDPKFTSLSPLNLSFQPDSPAPGLGILPLDTRQMGRIKAPLLPASDLHVLPRGP